MSSPVRRTLCVSSIRHAEKHVLQLMFQTCRETIFRRAQAFTVSLHIHLPFAHLMGTVSSAGQCTLQALWNTSCSDLRWAASRKVDASLSSIARHLFAAVASSGATRLMRFGHSLGSSFPALAASAPSLPLAAPSSPLHNFVGSTQG